MLTIELHHFSCIWHEEPHIPLFASPEFLGTSRRGLYGDAVEEMDDSIGQLLAKLKSTGLDENTLVIFTSDNGAWINPNSGIPGTKGDPLAGGSNAPFQDGKGSTWEGGVREPAVLYWPERILPGLSMEPVTMMDFFPTLLDLANISPNPNVTLDGKSLVPLLFSDHKKKKRQSIHDSIFFWRESVLMAVRQGAWKAHWVTRPGNDLAPPVSHDPPLLFNVEFDPSEQNPVNVTTQPDVLQSITAAYQQHLKTVVPGISQYEGQDWSLIPCCNGTFDEVVYEEALKDHEYGLALWDVLGCVCEGTP